MHAASRNPPPGLPQFIPKITSSSWYLESVGEKNPKFHRSGVILFSTPGGVVMEGGF